MWPSVNVIVLINQIAIRSEKTHEVTRCKQAQRKMNMSSLKQEQRWDQKNHLNSKGYQDYFSDPIGRYLFLF